ncbi:cysteine hydrolase family protein [Pseudoxanthomonas mexicana]|uniref:cysteine hydrolase family protein n=1 Tax=Pseudoxanthomonas mexicana TaxID=128785 RepID=UPI00398BB6AF
MTSRTTAPTPSALLIIDMINLFDFPQGKALARNALAAARRIDALRRRYRRAGAPIVYVNDNFMKWQADFNEIVALCSHPASPGAQVATMLRPEPEDYFILKPKHSAFLATPLPILLAKLGATRLVLTGVSAESCIAATAMDANMREFDVEIPRDCVASSSPARSRQALELLACAGRVRVLASSAVRP